MSRRITHGLSLSSFDTAAGSATGELDAAVEISDLAIPARDGFALTATLFRARRSPGNGPLVVVASGTGVRRGFYSRYATFLAERGLPTLTFDYRGIGDSRPRSLRGFEARMRDWGELDVAGVIDWAHDRLQASRLLVVGHSVGGQLFGVIPNGDHVDGLLAVTVQNGYWRQFPRPRRYLLGALWYGLLPALCAVTGRFPARALRLGEDLPAGVATEWARWCRHPRYLVDRDGRSLDRYFERFTSPVLAFSFEDDSFAPAAAIEDILARFVAAPVEHRRVRPSEIGVKAIGHFGFFRPATGGALWEESATWLAGHE